MKVFRRSALMVCFAMLTSLPPAFTQPPDPGGDPGVPIDGGASLLVGAAVLYGAKKLKDRKK